MTRHKRAIDPSMDRSLKERLVGAAVLVGLAVWLVPWVLDGPAPDAGFEAAQPPASGAAAALRTQTIRLDEGGTSAARTGAADDAGGARAPGSTAGASAGPEQAPFGIGEILAAPASEPVAADTGAAAPPDVAAAVSAAATEVAPAAASTEPSRTRSTETPREPAPGWVVQLGSFGEEENARRLADRVEALGYTANLSTYTASGRPMYRVRVGPESNRESAADIASSLIAQGVRPAQVVSSN